MYRHTKEELCDWTRQELTEAIQTLETEVERLAGFEPVEYQPVLTSQDIEAQREFNRVVWAEAGSIGEVDDGVELTFCDEDAKLHRELAESQQYNDLFRRCTRRALDLWLERHPGAKRWSDTAENICWLAEENEQLRKALWPYAYSGNWFSREYSQRHIYAGQEDGDEAWTGAVRALGMPERNSND